jgi:DNA polymerase
VSDDANQARVVLWLKSERALGLSAVPFPRRKLSSRATGPARPAAARPSSSAAPSPVAPQRTPTPPRIPIAAPTPAPRPATVPVPATSAPASTAPAPLAPPRIQLSTTRSTPARMDIVTPFASPVLSTEEKRQRLDQLNRSAVSTCTRCRLSGGRTNTVFGEGDVDAQIMFIGEGPGETEDLQGRPFVGKAGDLLTKMILAMGLTREQVFIANIVKCRPPGNRQPAGDEVAACTPYLLEQIEVVRPRVIVTLGLPASQFMLCSTETMGRLRGHWYNWRGIRLMPTYHPSYVIRCYTPEVRNTVWGDLKMVLVELGLAPPPRTKSV